MLQYYIYPIALLIILAILFIPVKFIVIRIVEKQKQKQRIVENYKNGISAIENATDKQKNRLTKRIKRGLQKVEQVSDGLGDIAADLKSQLNELK